MRIAIIDLGTNTFNLLIAEVGIQAKIIYNQKISVKLGEGGIQNNYLQDTAVDRAIIALSNLKTKCEELKTVRILSFGTSAIRNASNRFNFIDKVKRELNIEIKIIDGNREAELIYKGVAFGVKLQEEKSLIIDIGGGSTEFIIANKHTIFLKESFEIGAARLLEIFNPSNPIRNSEVENIEDFLSKKLSHLFEICKENEIIELIGSSGSFDTLAEVIQHRKNLPLDLLNITEYSFHLNDFYNVYEFLLGTTLNQRLSTKGINPIRAEMIVVSSVLTNFIVKQLNISKMRLSTYSLKEGVLSEFIMTNPIFE